MAPFEVLYRRWCPTPPNWIEPEEKLIFGPDIVEEAEATIHHIQDNLKAAKSRQETYANKRHQPLAFKVGNHVYLRVSPMKGVKSRTVAYTLDLPPSLAGVHNIFHISQLKKRFKTPVDVVLPEVTSLKADLSYPEHPIKILD
jgi:hypothetical protein